jgi:hypothetical protein
MIDGSRGFPAALDLRCEPIVDFALDPANRA